MTDFQLPEAPDKGASSVKDELIAGIHFFIVADILVFAALFVGFMVERSADVELFNQSANLLNAWVGITNTLILVTSGLCVVLAVDSARQGKTAQTRLWLVATFVIGAGFGVSKIMEYSDKISHDITMHTNGFFMFYYALTGAHFLHFIGGMGALAFMWFQTGKEAVDGKLFGTLESVALYWHMVDLLWIFIFPLLYLLGA
ncbi:MAG: cytochrome c oxidase subunit 3 [Porticoccaceae bacterium]|nr:cytochrome c oxidase subunit 3 [Pseudomonadales bacterium]